jgi:hypothetical protein
MAFRTVCFSRIYYLDATVVTGVGLRFLHFGYS